ncbi:MAG: glycosyltransferase family 2 protein [Thermoanaerobaculia bacterium]
MSSPSERISLVLTILDEAESLPALLEEIDRVFRDFDLLGEVLAVDDGSTDGSRAILLNLRPRYPRLNLRVLALERNHGKSAALDAGIRAAREPVIVTMDADLQDDPADIPALLRALEGCEAATGVRARRKDGPFKRVSSRIGNRVRNLVLREKIADSGGPLKAIRKDVLIQLRTFDGFHRFLPTLLRMDGARVVEVDVRHRPRRFGRSKYGIRNRMVASLLDLLAVAWMRRRRFDYIVEEK